MSEILSLWNETPAKKAIVDYVNTITNPESADFVPETERIAILDNDGTMWIEAHVCSAFLCHRQAEAYG